MNLSDQSQLTSSTELPAELEMMMRQWANWLRESRSRGSKDSIGRYARNLRCFDCYELPNPCQACLASAKPKIATARVVDPYQVEVALQSLPEERRRFLRDWYAFNKPEGLLRRVYALGRLELTSFRQRSVWMLANVLRERGALKI